MATDYDAPRKTDEELAEDSLEELKARRADKANAAVDIDEAELAETLELPGADLSEESLTVRVLPKQRDEFTCSKDRKSTRLNSSHSQQSRMPSSA